jgi:hypothetical protein
VEVAALERFLDFMGWERGPSLNRCFPVVEAVRNGVVAQFRICLELGRSHRTARIGLS